MKNQNNIVDGPSKYDLSVAFFDRAGGHRRHVTFTLTGPDFPQETGIDVVINSICWEDGSGESWCFTGYIRNGGIRVSGWFKTSNRQGWIKPAE